ncbi:MAG: cytochrome P450, partial [Rhizobiales bacterium]|nr:cytochrome P450 [Hyphomicrobiales bacterium]
MTVPSVVRDYREPTVPPAIVPPDRPPGPLSLLVALLRNPLRALSADHYQESILVYSGLGGTTAFVMAPELIGEVFHNPSNSFAKNPLDRRIMARLLGNGIIVAPDEDWRWQRRIVAPMFTPAGLAHTVPIIASAAHAVLE